MNIRKRKLLKLLARQEATAAPAVAPVVETPPVVVPTPVKRKTTKATRTTKKTV